MGRAWCLKSLYPGVLNIEIAVMVRNDRIAINGCFKRRNAVDAARDDRVRIDDAIGIRLDVLRFGNSRLRERRIVRLELRFIELQILRFPNAIHVERGGREHNREHHEEADEPPSATCETLGVPARGN